MFGTRPRVYRPEEFPRLVDEIVINDGGEWGVQHVLYAQDITGQHDPGWCPETVLVETVNGQWGAAYFRGPDRRAWITCAASPPSDPPGLLYDPYNESTFPADAVMRVDELRAVIEEYLRTGQRPTCAQWQEPDRYLVY